MLRTKKKMTVPKESILDTVAYLAWFVCCMGFTIHLWLQKMADNSGKSFRYHVLYMVYLGAQAVSALGHLTPFISLRFIGQIFAAVGYHLLFLSYFNFIPPYNISSISVFTLSCCTGIILITSLLKYYAPSEPRATYAQTDTLCILYYISGAVLGLSTIIKVYIDTKNPVIYRAVFAGICGAANMFWPKVFPVAYFRILSRLSDCFLYVPWVVFAVEELDSISSQVLNAQ